MEICLVRHAIAADRGTPGYENDDLRPLTAKGRERMREAALGLMQLVTPQVVLTSPLVRAVETAEILTAAYRLSAPPRVEALASGDDDALLEALVEAGAGTVMLVGHEPHISGTLSLLLTGDSSRLAVDFKKGAAALVSCQGEPAPGSCWLEWYLPPVALRRLGGSSRG